MTKAAALALAAATLVAAGAFAKDVLPESGPLAPNTMQRLLLVDGARAGNRVVAVGDRGYIVTSDDQGATWKRAKAPSAPLLTAVGFIDEKRGWAVGHDSIILATTDGGDSWARQFSAPAEHRPLLGVLFLDAQRGFAIGAYGAFYETTNGGAALTPRKVTADDKHLNAILDVGKGRLVILGEAGTILRSPDSGATWQAVASPYKGSFFGGIVAHDGSVLAFGLRGRIYRSADAGATWTQVANPSDAAIMSATLLADGAVLLSGNAGSLLVSRDNGQTVTAIASGRRGVIAKSLAGSSGALLLLGEAGARSLPVAAPPK